MDSDKTLGYQLFVVLTTYANNTPIQCVLRYRSDLLSDSQMQTRWHNFFALNSIGGNLDLQSIEK